MKTAPRTVIPPPPPQPAPQPPLPVIHEEPQPRPAVVPTPQPKAMPTPEESARQKADARKFRIREFLARQIADGTANMLERCMETVEAAWTDEDEMDYTGRN